MAIDDVFFSPNCFSPGNENIKSSNNTINKTYTENLFNIRVLLLKKKDASLATLETKTSTQKTNIT